MFRDPLPGGRSFRAYSLDVPRDPWLGRGVRLEPPAQCRPLRPGARDQGAGGWYRRSGGGLSPSSGGSVVTRDIPWLVEASP